MKLTTLTACIAAILFITSCKERKKEEEVSPVVTDASFTYTLSNNGIAPCSVSLKASKDNAYYTWLLNKVFISNKKETTAEIKKEGFYPVELKVTNGAAEDIKRDTITVYSEEYLKADKITKDSIACKSFRYKGRTFQFRPNNDSIHFQKIPYFYPKDLGTALYEMSVSSDEKSDNTSVAGIERGESILYFDVTLRTDKVDIREKLKVYIHYSNDCLDSVKVYDYLK